MSTFDTAAARREHQAAADYNRRCAENEGGRARLAIDGYANADTAYYFAREAAHYARLVGLIDQFGSEIQAWPTINRPRVGATWVE